MGNLATAILRFSSKLPDPLRYQLRRLFIGEYFRAFACNPDFGQERIAPEADAVLSFIRQRVGALAIRDYRRNELAPFSYVGVAAAIAWDRVSGVGVHPVFGRALFSAVAEFLERYVLIKEQGGGGVSASPRELNRRGSSFLSLDAASGFRQANISDDARLLWIKCKSLFDDEEILLPAQTVFWNYDIDGTGEPFIREPNISGAASASTEDEALEFGIYELIERDAFLLHWFKKITPSRVIPESINDREISYLASEAKRRGLRTHILDITSDIAVPAYMVVLVGQTPPMVNRGFSSNLDSTSAIKKAFYEAWGNYILNSRILAEPQNVLSQSSPMTERYRLWLAPAAFEYFKFILSGPEIALTASTRSKENRLKVLKEIFSERGHEIYCYAAGHTLLDELGLSVVKVIIPDLIHLYFKEKNAESILAVPRINGKVKNRYPHPFA